MADDSLAGVDALRHPAPWRLRVLVAGGGVAGLETLVALRAFAGPRVDATLVDPADEFHLSALDAGEPFGLARARRYPLAELAAGLDSALVRDSVREVASDAHAVLLEGGDRLEYDALVLAVGATRRPALDHGVGFDPVNEAAALRGLRRRLEAEPGGHVAVVVPTGVGWTLPAYELALMLAGIRATRVTLVTAERQPLEAFGPPAAEMVREELARDGVDLIVGEPVQAGPGRLTLRDGGAIDVDHLVHLPRMAGPRIAGVPSDDDGFIRTDDRGRVDDRPDVFAVGDGTAGRLKQGGLAAQQSEQAAVAIARRAGAEVDEPAGGPVLRAVLRTRRGMVYLRAEPPGGGGQVTVSREALWWPPTKVSSSWLMPWLATGGTPGAMAAEPQLDSPGSPSSVKEPS